MVFRTWCGALLLPLCLATDLSSCVGEDACVATPLRDATELFQHSVKVDGAGAGAIAASLAPSVADPEAKPFGAGADETVLGPVLALLGLDLDLGSDGPSGGDQNVGAWLLKQLIIPLCALVAGPIILLVEKYKVNSKPLEIFATVVTYFGAMTTLNLYMKAVLSMMRVSADLKGLPAAFAVTVVQQLVSFTLYAVAIGFSWMTPYAYTPKKLTTRKEWTAVWVFALSFCLNITLNNFSLQLLPISINLVIRSCLPITTFICQRACQYFEGKELPPVNPAKIFLLLSGVACVAVATVAFSGGKHHATTESPANFILGVVLCIVSVVAGGMNMAIAGALGTSLGLNPFDSVLYMALPVGAYLVFFLFFFKHTVWPGVDAMSDWQVLSKVATLNWGPIIAMIFSGVLASVYNVYQYFIVQQLSATWTSFSGNFNKAATIILAMALHFESPPPGVRGLVMELAIAGCILSFCGYSLLSDKAKH